MSRSVSKYLSCLLGLIGLLNYFKRREISKEIEQLDAVKDHERIVYLIACHCFPYDIERSLEFGFFRTFAVPSISRLLASTGEFKRNTKKRYRQIIRI